MKLAIPYWHGRVSPVFDVAQNVLLVDVEKEREIKRVTRSLDNRDLFNRAQYVLQLGAQMIICGAISEAFLMMLQSAGVRVVSNVCGPIDDVLEAFLNDTLTNSDFCMPGFNTGQRRHRKRRSR